MMRVRRFYGDAAVRIERVLTLMDAVVFSMSVLCSMVKVDKSFVKQRYSMMILML